MYFPVTEIPLSMEDLDHHIADLETVEELFRYLNPKTWKQDLDSIYTQTHLHYRSRAYHLAGRYNKGKDLQTIHALKLCGTVKERKY